MSAVKRGLSRAAAVLLPLALLGAVAFGAVLPAMQETARLGSALAEERALGARYRALGEGRAAAEAGLEALREAQFASANFVAGETGPVAAAALQARLSSLAEQLGASVSSVGGGHGPVGDDGLQRIEARLSVRASIDSIAALLAEVERAQPLLFVERLAIQAPLETRGRDVRSPRVIGADLTVAGMRLVETGGAR